MENGRLHIVIAKREKGIVKALAYTATTNSTGSAASSRLKEMSKTNMRPRSRSGSHPPCKFRIGNNDKIADMGNQRENKPVSSRILPET